MNEERAAIKQEIDFKKKEEKDTIKKKLEEEKLIKLEELAKKIVMRELRKEEFEDNHKKYLAEKARKDKIKEEENLRKLFVGGLSCEDIKHACTQINGRLDKERYTELQNARSQNLIEIFRKYGEIVKVKEFWENKHCFITFANIASAEKAIDTLSDYEERKIVCISMKEEIVRSKKEVLTAVKPNFYIRWNKNRSMDAERVTPAPPQKTEAELQAAKDKAKKEQDRKVANKKAKKAAKKKKNTDAPTTTEVTSADAPPSSTNGRGRGGRGRGRGGRGRGGATSDF